MNVNITIFIQIINFFIGYLILKHLLFKPASKYILEEEKKEQGMSEKIKTQQLLLDKKIEERQATWKEYQAHFQKTCPKPITQQLFVLKQAREEPTTKEISEKEVDSVAKEVEKAFIERIKHVR